MHSLMVVFTCALEFERRFAVDITRRMLLGQLSLSPECGRSDQCSVLKV